MWTTIVASHDLNGWIMRGPIAPRAAWINGQPITDDQVRLHAGATVLVLEYDPALPGRTWYLMSSASPDEHPPRPQVDLATRWWQDARILPCDVRPHEIQPSSWYRFTAPPGLRQLILPLRGTAEVWVNDVACTSADDRLFTVKNPARDSVVVRIRVTHKRGSYAGAAFDGPIEMTCDEGHITLGDWSALDGLASYSGGAWYRQEISVPSPAGAVLDLGDVAGSAEVRINGQVAGVRVAPPWRLDIGHLLQCGNNLIEVLVCNTLANHYQTIPTQYHGSPRSGLIGPVTIHFSA